MNPLTPSNFSSKSVLTPGNLIIAFPDNSNSILPELTPNGINVGNSSTRSALPI
jgi:hypothetical protein